MIKTIFRYFACMILICGAGMTYASLVIPVYSTTTGEEIGTVKADDTIYGLLLTPRLFRLSPGTHGFHIHTGALCRCAGGHLDPRRTLQHRGPYQGNGHLGDLPVLIVNARGVATLPVLAPRLRLDTIKNHTLMIHAGSDNYHDKPKINGGGGEMIACGEIPYF